MYGSIFYNLWIALSAFTLYFFVNFLSNEAPLKIVLYSFMWAGIAFLLTFILRAIIAYIVYTPEEAEVVEEAQEVESIEVTKDETTHTSEEIAEVVKSMINEDE